MLQRDIHFMNKSYKVCKPHEEVPSSFIIQNLKHEDHQYPVRKLMTISFAMISNKQIIQFIVSQLLRYY